jgi:hypothetical protein
MALLPVAALAIACLAVPATAVADCMCVGPDETLLGVPTDESPGPLAIAGTPAAGQPRTPSNVPWCRSADDPRCRADQSGDGPSGRALATAPAAVVPATPRLPRPGVVRQRFYEMSARAPRGVRTRVDRPPRA